MPTERTPKEIAKGLTKAQKRALLRVASGVWPPSSPRFDVACRLDDAGLIYCENWTMYGLRSYPARITDLGRAVAALLAQPAPSETEGRE